ncbi:hypothetical protein SKAU_G00171080 [Synaphobranchus kaupii]|uniref:Uncharacterized protein n=1 Tax=Synaphobranchus kaupii TaxID=118154 RepID=A0A9Q1FKP0_SYNKA|nr:hypothetical protein SKAU_G00171080 [Synaphobranchus kaupii]
MGPQNPYSQDRTVEVVNQALPSELARLGMVKEVKSFRGAEQQPGSDGRVPNLRKTSCCLSCAASLVLLQLINPSGKLVLSPMAFVSNSARQCSIKFSQFNLAEHLDCASPPSRPGRNEPSLLFTRQRFRRRVWRVARRPRDPGLAPLPRFGGHRLRITTLGTAAPSRGGGGALAPLSAKSPSAAPPRLETRDPARELTRSPQPSAALAPSSGSPSGSRRRRDSAQQCVPRATQEHPQNMSQGSQNSGDVR